MTNLNQAFIKAYGGQPDSGQPDGGHPDGASPDERIPLSEALGISDSNASGVAENTAWLRQQAAATVPAPHANFPASVAEPELAESKLVESKPIESTLAEAKTAERNAAESMSIGTSAVVQKFRPLLEVDEFIMPPTCRELCATASKELGALADALAYESSNGINVLAVDACAAGEGTTTLTICLADCLSKLGVKVVIVDANPCDPQLAPRLNLAPEAGWEKSLTEELPLDEVVIEACNAPISVLPLRGSTSSANNLTKYDERMAADIETLRSYFDLVLIDMPPLENRALIDGLLSGRFAEQLDAILLTQNEHVTPDDRLVELRKNLNSTSVKQAGIVRTFVRAA